MRETIRICVGIVLGIWTTSSPAMTITGQVVDNRARPVPRAEVVVCAKEQTNFWDEEARTISSVVRTDATGRFAFDVEVTSPGDSFIVARKPGLAHAWEWLTLQHFLLVLEPPGVLAGQVVDPEGKPVAGAEVRATPMGLWGFSPYTPMWSVAGPTAWFAVTTDAQGRFRFEQLAADVSTALRVQAPGGASRYVFRPYGFAYANFEMGRTDIRLVLPREGTIRGQVVDDQGRPVGGVALTVHSGRERTDMTNQYVARRTSADRAGTFVFEGVPEGPQEVELLTSEREFAQWAARAQKVLVQAGAVTQATLRVGKGSILEVTALDAQTRRPVPGARLEATGREFRRSPRAIADAKGVARLRVPADFYALWVTAPQFSHCQSMMQVMEGQTVRREALLPPDPTVRVSGHVLDPQGRPAVDVVVFVFRSPGGGGAHTDSQGRFTAACSGPPGTEEGFVMGRDMKRSLAAAVPVSDLSQPIELRLEPAWTLTGRVTEPNGTPIPAARVSLGMKLPGALSDNRVGALSDPAGRFEMKAIPLVHKSFTYYLSANAAGYGQASRLRIFPKGPPGTAVDIGTVRLLPADASVSGVVVDAQGAPAARVQVFTNSWPEYQPHKNTVTNERGEFTFTRVCRGRIIFQANPANAPGGASYLRTRLPAQNVKIVLGKDLTELPKPATSNAAPAQLIDLCPDLSFLHTDGRPLLLCFVDIAQHPSKQFLVDLAKRTDALEAKDIIVVVVRTSTIDLRPYDAFAKANRLSFCSLCVQDDFETRKLPWGIKSLPWLILIDRRHVVIAQGFALDQLENRIREVDHAKP